MSTSAPALTRPIVRYHGGKWRIAPWIIAQFPPHRCYVESFGGGASVLLRKPRVAAEVYNDLDREIVNLFEVARERGNELVRAVELTPFSRSEFDVSYNPQRHSDPLERARRTLVRSFMGHGADGTCGRWRTGFRGLRARGTVPATEWANIPKSLPAVIERLRGVVIENRDAVEVMRKYDSPCTLHYVDPPYVSTARGRVRGYAIELSDDCHRRMAECVRGLVGAVVLSGYDCPLYDELFGDWRQVRRATMADSAQPRTEVLWIKP